MRSNTPYLIAFVALVLTAIWYDTNVAGASAAPPSAAARGAAEPATEAIANR
jgi:hypothetical protein